MPEISEEKILERVTALSGFEFERFVASLWELQGWKTEVTDTIGNGGRDIIARRTLPYEESIKIEAKCWQRDRVPEPFIRQYALLPGEGLDQAVIVTSSEFTKPAKRAAQRHDVKLVNGTALAVLIDKLQAAPLLTDAHDVEEWRAVRSEHHIAWRGHLPVDGEPVDVLPGIGSTRRAQLADAGIHSVAELLSADPETLAGEMDVSPGRIHRWVNLATCHQQSVRTDAIDGIGDEDVRLLADLGIHTLEDLRDSCAREVAERSDLREMEIKQWIGEAVRWDVDMVTVIDGIGTERAMDLAGCGILTVGDLAEADPTELSSACGLDASFLRSCVEEAGDRLN